MLLIFPHNTDGSPPALVHLQCRAATCRVTTNMKYPQEFPSAAVTAEGLVLTLPLIKPRHYSISSAAEANPERLQLTVGVLNARNERDGTTREGLCSHHLRRLAVGEVVRLAVRPSRFRAPVDLSASPVIMVSGVQGHS